MSGLIGKKIGMTSIWDASGRNIPCTVIEAGPCVVTQVKTKEKDGYDAIQLSFGERKEKHTSKALKGHFAKANTTPKQVSMEFTRFEEGHRKSFGEVLTADVFSSMNSPSEKTSAVRTSPKQMFSPKGNSSMWQVSPRDMDSKA